MLGFAAEMEEYCDKIYKVIKTDLFSAELYYCLENVYADYDGYYWRFHKDWLINVSRIQKLERLLK